MKSSCRSGRRRDRVAGPVVNWSSHHEIAHRIPDLQRAGPDGLHQHHEPGRRDRPPERDPGRAAPLQRHAHHGQRVSSTMMSPACTKITNAGWSSSRPSIHRPTAVPAQPHRRRQRRRSPQAPGHGPRGRGGDHQGKAGLRPLGADLLRRVRRAQSQAGAGQGDRRVICLPSTAGSVTSGRSTAGLWGGTLDLAASRRRSIKSATRRPTAAAQISRPRREMAVADPAVKKRAGSRQASRAVEPCLPDLELSVGERRRSGQDSRTRPPPEGWQVLPG